MDKRWKPRLLAGLITLSMLGAACSSDEPTAGADTTTATTEPQVSTAPPPTEAPATTEAAPTTEATAPETSTPSIADRPLSEPDAATDAALTAALAANGESCDPLDERTCLFPFPSNAYTVADDATNTGLRVAMAPGSAPSNTEGVPINLTEWNRNDGFSPNSQMLTLVPGIDVDNSQLPPWTDLGASLEDAATVVVIDSETGERVPLFAELDAKAAADEDRALIIRPAVPLHEGGHYVVALRRMQNAAGETIEPGAVFRAYRDRIAWDALEPRRPVMEETFATLDEAGVARDDLYLAWDFTVASERSLSERMLSIRDQALQGLGETAAPPFAVTAVTNIADSNIALQITGTFTVPNFLTGDGLAGNGFNYGDNADDPDALPVQNGTAEVGFTCNVSQATLYSTTEPAHLVLYGHGLLGSNEEINAGNVRAFADEHNIVFCATKWAGMSEDDVGNAAATLGEISNFNTVADRLQQGVLNQIFLGRLMTREGGLSTVPELHRADGSLLIDPAHLDYDGNSQGGIMGIMLAAVSPDIERAVVGVPGINYSFLLPRSVDFATYEAIFKPAYPNDLDRTLNIGLLQMLWDRGEGGGYVQHVTSDPYPGTDAKPILLDVAFGDWQVSELTAMVAARAMNVPISRPVTGSDRSREVDPGWGLETIEYPSDGSGIVIWDSGSDPIPLEQIPPSTSRDPHQDPRADVDVRTQKAAFLFDDTLIDVCTGAPCPADNSD